MPRFFFVKRSGHAVLIGVMLLACSLGACGKAVRHDIPPQPLRLTTPKGAAVDAVFYATRVSNPPGLILVPGYAGGQKRWEACGRQAQLQGMHCLSIDAMRTEPDSGDLKDAFEALDGAMDALIAHGADPKNLAIAAESNAAPIVLEYARNRPSAVAVILVSPAPECASISARNAIIELGKRPVLLMAATGDSLAASTARQLKQAAPGQCEMREYAGSAHGTDLLDTSSQAMGQIFVWLTPIIGPHA